VRTVRRPARRSAGPLLVLIAIAALGPLAACGPAAAEIGKDKPVPNITGTTLDGAAFDLASLRGRPVVLNFWGPSCVPCRTEFPLLAAKATEHAADGLAIVGILTDDPIEPARAFAAQNGGTWPTVIDPGGAVKATHPVLGRPQSYFVDRAAILRSIQIGEVVAVDFERQYAAIAGPT
jgi:cytochrome c biogenesis protein CcmG/thiol:disulfide interchange protein DsbE